MLTTIVFTNIVGSTERAAALGDDRWRELLDNHHTPVRHELKRSSPTILSDSVHRCLSSSS